MPDQNERTVNEGSARAEFRNLRVVDSVDLLAGERTVVIRHDDDYYRLTVTRNNKLLLQK